MLAYPQREHFDYESDWIVAMLGRATEAVNHPDFVQYEQLSPAAAAVIRNNGSGSMNSLLHAFEDFKKWLSR